MTSDEVVANPEGNNSEEDHPITADNSVYNSYVADIDSVFLPFTEYSPSKGIAGFLLFSLSFLFTFGLISKTT